MRPARLLAVAWRDLRLISGGRGWWKLPALAAGLLLPVGVIPLDIPTSLEALPARAQGQIPESLQALIEPSAQAPVGFTRAEEPTIRATRIPLATREALDTLPGPSVRIEDLGSEPELPGRSLLVALLALSLMTGPLAESLAGERAKGTLTTLLAAGISRSELAWGKWLAWTGSATLATALVAIGGLASGSQEWGPWPLGLPLVAGAAVALGLWLGRSAADEVGSATRTMRVLPMAALLLGGAAWFLRGISPALGAAVPLGGALLVAGNLAVSPVELLAALVGNGLAITAMLAGVTRALDGRPPWVDVPGLLRDLALIGAAALCWWLPIIGPGIWGIAGNAELSASLDPRVGLATGALLFLGIVGIDAARLHTSTGLKPPSLLGISVGFAAGGALAVLTQWELPELGLASGELAEMAQLRLGRGVLPPVAVFALVLPAQELLFRGWLQRRSPLLALLAWVLVCTPLDPVTGLISGLLLGGLSRWKGWWAALAAHLGWWAVAGLLGA